jgi:hypothetical protein
MALIDQMGNRGEDGPTTVLELKHSAIGDSLHLVGDGEDRFGVRGECVAIAEEGKPGL